MSCHVMSILIWNPQIIEYRGNIQDVFHLHHLLLHLRHLSYRYLQWIPRSPPGSTTAPLHRGLMQNKWMLFIHSLIDLID